MNTFGILQITLLLRSKQVISIVDLINVNLAQFFHVLEHLVGQDNAFARIIEGFRVVLILTKNGAKLKLELAFLIDAAVALADFLALVEFMVTNERDTLLQIENALFKHAKLLEAHRHVVVSDE